MICKFWFVILCHVAGSGFAVYGKIDKEENVLIIIADDFRPLLREWGDELARTPNIDSLAKKSVVFRNAYAQLAAIAIAFEDEVLETRTESNKRRWSVHPAWRKRQSEGEFATLYKELIDDESKFYRRPDTLRLYDFYSYWRETAGNFTTLPQYFKDKGYLTHSIGKVLHPGESSNFTDDFPYSWSQTTYHPSTEKYKESPVCKTEKGYHRNLVCPVVVEFQPEHTLPDIQSTQEAARFLNTNHKKPYFLAVGLHKPHVPLKYPCEYLDLYPLDNITLPVNYGIPYNLPYPAWNPWTDVRNRDDIRQLHIPFPYGRIPDEWAKKIIQSYYAAVSYIDDLIGQILQNVNFNNTAVVIMSDHGWSLGEHGEWSKFSNYDVALKVPLIIYTPKLKRKIVDNIVELIDVFPTIAEIILSEKIPKCSDTNISLCTEGKSLLPLIIQNYSKNINQKHMAFSQYPRPGYYPTEKPNSDKPRLQNIKIMGYTVRTKRYRYTEWVAFNHTTFKPNFGHSYGMELYDHLIDQGENLNLVDRKEMEYVASSLKKILIKEFDLS